MYVFFPLQLLKLFVRSEAKPLQMPQDTWNCGASSSTFLVTQQLNGTEMKRRLLRLKESKFSVINLNLQLHKKENFEIYGFFKMFFMLCCLIVLKLPVTFSYNSAIF